MSLPARHRGAVGAILLVLIVLVLLGVLATYVLSRIATSSGDDTQTTTRLAAAAEALEAFASSALRLPCPADPTADTGQEVPTAVGAATCSFPEGTVPWRTVGLKRDDAFDSWGRKISYRVYTGNAGSLTQPGGVSMVNCDTVEATPGGTTAVAGGRTLGAAALGNFRFGMRLVTQLTQPVLMACAWTIQPTLLRLADEPARAREVALRSFRLVTFVAFPIGAAFIPFGVPIAVLLFGDAWRGAGIVMAALSGMGIALALEAVSIEIFKVTGRPDILPRLHGLWAVLSIALVIALVRFGAVGAGIAWSLSTAIVALVAVAVVPRTLGVSRRQLAEAILPALAGALLVANALRLGQVFLGWEPRANIATLGWLLVQAAAGIGAYVGVMSLFARSGVRELVDVLRLLLSGRR